MSKSSDLSFTKEFDTVSVEKGRGVKMLLRFLLVLIFLSFSLVSFIGGAYFSKLNNTPTNIEAAQVVASMQSVNARYTDVSDSVVKVIVYNSGAKSESTGTVISQDGYILCCDHIFSGIASPNIMVVFNDLTRCNAAYIGGDDRLDISVIKVEKTGLSVIELGSDQPIKAGDNVYTVGYNGAGDYQSVTKGVISALNQRLALNTQYPVDSIQFDAPVSPGNSGSPLINDKGEMIAMVTSKNNMQSYDGIGYAVDSNKIKDKLSEIIEYGCVQNYVKLGVSVEYVGLADTLTSNGYQGMKLQIISPESDLYGMGFETGEVITSINGVKINHISVFYDQLEAMQAGNEVELVIIKPDSTERSITVRTFSEKGENSYTY